MITSLGVRFQKFSAWQFLAIFYLQLISPVFSAANGNNITFNTNYSLSKKINAIESSIPADPTDKIKKRSTNKRHKNSLFNSPKKVNIGGPSSPEASSFKSVGSNNLVNLFTGDFSYSIQLLDIEGYPVNLFYSAGIGMEQEASWVGLGWNLNPGSISRNMRGIPDDFDGTDQLIQKQNTKPNVTWGGTVGVNGEALGIPAPNVNFSLGFSHNNYLGPEIELGAGISFSIPIADKIKYEKTAENKDTAVGVTSLSLDLGLGGKLSSRSGLTLSPSLNCNVSKSINNTSFGIGLNTSYNSRTGISQINLSSEVSKYYKNSLDKEDVHGESKQGYSIGRELASTHISFAKPSYVPNLRMPMMHTYYSGQLELGAGMFGLKVGGTASGYKSTSKVPIEYRVISKPMVGYLYSENAVNNVHAVMDLNRVNDQEVTPNTPIISAPQYTFDIFSIQGEGTGGSIRAFRGDMGFMRDNLTTSVDENLSIGFDIAPPGHFGGNWDEIFAPTVAGGWMDHDNRLQQNFQFKPTIYNSSFQNVYFKNPGETTVTEPSLLDRLGGDSLVRFQLSGPKVASRVEAVLELFNKKSPLSSSKLKNINSAINFLQKRDKLSQVTTMLTAKDASIIGLDTSINNYQGTFDNEKNIMFTRSSRIDQFRKAHHISEINVLEKTGMRYVYGLPVYNLTQQEYTFSVAATPSNNSDNIVQFQLAEANINSPHNNTSSRSIDGMVQIQNTPPYASAFMLTGLLSPDYVDISNNGITEDDLGNAVKFNYTKTGIHKWRTPRVNATAQSAYFNEGVKTEKKDNKAIITYGEREVWYIQSIESKSMIAIFKIASRNDAKGVKDSLDGRIDTLDNSNKRLIQIDLYTKTEIKNKGIAAARPLKTVHFEYDYSLCNGTPDNYNGGKLTLKSVYFSFNGQQKESKNKYVFNYGNNNPAYKANSSDRWGTYKNSATNPEGFTNAEYPFTPTNSSDADNYASAWNLKKILLPSGGQMEIDYEADDYGYVQDRAACQMYRLKGLGNSTNYSNDNALYPTGIGSTENKYVFVEVPRSIEATTANGIKNEIKNRYLNGINQLAFSLWINMPKGQEKLNSYSEFEDYGLCTNSTNKNILYFKLKQLDGKSPLAKSATGYLIDNLPGQAFENYDVQVDGLEDFLGLVINMLGSLKNAFSNVEQQVRSRGLARTIDLNKSSIRLNNPFRIKYGGGYRVKKIVVKDNWNRMKQEYSSSYGQEYDYSTTENISSRDSIISSGVASYEPGIGSEENPFREIVIIDNKLPMASARYGAIELPILEGFYPSPVVGYSKVTVRSINRKGKFGDSTLRSAIGKQVTEFYTAKEFPAYSVNTPMTIVNYNKNPVLSLFYKEIIARKTVSQGFMVETNDMHGKMKMQAAFSEKDSNTALSKTMYSYKNTGKKGNNEKVDFVYNEEGGQIKEGNIGIDVELMTDVREFKVSSDGFKGQVQAEIMTFLPVPFSVFPMIPINTYTENLYRAVTCTKVINYHAIEDSVIVMDKGSVISTKTILFDSETGNPIVTRTGNEFNDTIFNTIYPAYWGYRGLGPAYKNVDRFFENVSFHDGKIVTSLSDNKIFESGDELYILNEPGIEGCAPTYSGIKKLWAIDKVKLKLVGAEFEYSEEARSQSMQSTTGDFIFIDHEGRPFSGANVKFRIVRSGARNLLDASIASITSLSSPIYKNGSNDYQLAFYKTGSVNRSRILNMDAKEYKEKWQTDNELFERQSLDTSQCPMVEITDCLGTLDKSINPYLKGLLGNFKLNRSMVYYGFRSENDPSSPTNIRLGGRLSNPKLYWDFNDMGIFENDTLNPNWIWKSEIVKINSKGQEIETKDALGIYTSAQYGFNKQLPIAISQNARKNEMVSEGFEENNYLFNINPGLTQNICADKEFNLPFEIGAQIINTDTMTFRAHTGKKVLRLKADSSLVTSIAFNTEILDDYDFTLRKEAFKSLNSYGGKYEKLPDATPSYMPNTQATVTFSNLSMNANFGFHNGTNVVKFGYKTSQYFEVTLKGNYSFLFTASSGHANNGNPIQMYAAISFKIYDMEGNYIGSHIYGGNNSNNSYTKYLNCGIYKIECVCYTDFYGSLMHSCYSIFSFQCTTADLTSYRNACTYTNPIPSVKEMFNPLFTFLPSKKMLLSAWVKEDCGNINGTPCYTTTYSDCNIKVGFGNGHSNNVTLVPTGTIIEGWQKIEGVFTVPNTINEANITFENTGTLDVYFDDIRIHPYNANMKSYVYNSQNLRLSAELDENNYATFYEYDEEGQLVRVKKETIAGIKTIKETRSAKQKTIVTVTE